MTGRKIAQYEILEKLGEGGMGTVYKARDTRLNRPAAIKVLRADVVSNEDRKRRFIQEAQSASALNHPNIVTIYDIIEQNGIDCIVMEFIDGKTLDAIIPRNGMRLNEALRIAVHIADGLRKAHGAGIIHRDIKPSNIMAAEDGAVKILDFGLAKLAGADEVGADDTTRAVRPETEEGTILGTVSYMSPEQAEGRKLDPRSDIFSFGALLYEMVAGHRAFSGDSRISTLSAILKEEPKALENIPSDLEKIIRRCVRKDPAKRFQHMDDLKVALDEVREDSESGKLDAAKPAVPRGSSWSRMAAIAAAAILAATAGGYFLWRTRHSGAPASLEYNLRQITSDSGLTTTPALSPDGRLIAYASDRRPEGSLDIWVQPLTQDARPIRLTTNPADDLSPSFSPDGGLLTFYSKRAGGGIYVVPALGGDERLLVRGKSGLAKPRFSPDGKSIAYSTGDFLYDSRVMTVPVSGGPPRTLAPNLAWAGNPVWSPNGKYLLATGRQLNNEVTMQYWVIPADGGAAVNTGFTPGNRSPPEEWTGGMALYAAQQALWGLPIEGDTWKAGTPRKLLASTAGLQHPRAVDMAGISPGRIVFAGESTVSHLWSIAIDSNTGRVVGQPQPLSHSGGNQTRPVLSPDGKLLAYTQEEPGRAELRIRDMTSAKETPVLSQYARAKFSPDSSRIAYSPRTNRGLYVMDISGGETIKLLDWGTGYGSDIYGWSTQGIVYWHGRPIHFSVLDPGTKQVRDLISHPTRDIHGAELSPDGRWVTFHVPGTTREPLYIAPIRDGKAAGQSEWILVSDSPGLNRRGWWSANGNLLYSISERDGGVGIWAQRLGPDKRPMGAPLAILRFPEARRAPDSLNLAAFGPGVVSDRIVYALQERSGNIWIAELNK